MLDDCISTSVSALSAPSSGGSALEPAPFSIPAREGSDEKGFQIKRTYHKEYAQVFLNWNQVERRINQLIDSDRLLSPEDKAKFPEYGRYVLSRNVDTLFAYAPELRPYVPEGFGEGWKKVRWMLDDTEKTDMLLSAMAEKLQSMSPSDRGYEACTTAYARYF